MNSTDFSEPEKDACRSSIQAYCADMLKSKKQERSELISNRISAELMLDIPTFCKTGNTNSFQKVLQSIGKIPENDRFNAVSTEANTQAICNYEKLDQRQKVFSTAIKRRFAIKFDLRGAYIRQIIEQL